MKNSLALVLLLLVGSQADAQTKPQNKRYTLVSPDSTQSWDLRDGRVTASQLAQSVTNSVVKRLSQKGLIRTRQLDVQCCTVQVELLEASANANSQQPHVSISTRITLLDVDKQSVYSKEYRGEASGKTKGTKAGLAAAADDVADRMIADNDMMRALAGS